MLTGIPGIDTVPSPPAFDTAAASFGVRNGPRPSWTIGCSIPTIRVYRFEMNDTVPPGARGPPDAADSILAAMRSIIDTRGNFISRIDERPVV
jgi:hypothetical protein